MKRILIIAPHPDDETLGCGGAILKHIDEGHKVDWLIATTNKSSPNITNEEIIKREKEIEEVSSRYSFAGVHNLELPTTLLDSIPKKEIIDSLSSVINKVKPEIIYIPNRLDAHSDHQIIHDCSIACTKPFRYPFIKTVRVYQTLSETGFNLRLESLGFKPNLLIDISNYLDKKIDIMNLYVGETSKHPFPRSEDSIRAQGILLGSMANCEYAEGFITLREIQ